ncbi:conserved hypothetical protein [Frigoribacterium sp. 9N]|nr:conserved hypothetical protein [Frigoribacterium sp. 9N]
MGQGHADTVLDRPGRARVRQGHDRSDGRLAGRGDHPARRGLRRGRSTVGRHRGHRHARLRHRHPLRRLAPGPPDHGSPRGGGRPRRRSP